MCDSLGRLHDVPAAAVVHHRALLRLLAQIHRLICTFAMEIGHESVCGPRPVAVGVAPVSVVTVVALQVQQRTDGAFMVSQLRFHAIFTTDFLSSFFFSNFFQFESLRV